MNRHLLILDLDETLIYATSIPLPTRHDFKVAHYFVYKRPFVEQFLNQVFEWYDVAVWTSAGSGYASAIVDLLFATPTQLKFVWSDERCTKRYHPERQEYYWVKDLKKVRRLGYSLENIVVVDDTSEKLERNYGNHLRVQEFVGSRDDAELRDVLPFLNSLRTANNVRQIEKRGWRSFTNRADS